MVRQHQRGDCRRKTYHVGKSSPTVSFRRSPPACSALARSGYVAPEAKAVETSRYSYATNRNGSRWYFSKPEIVGCDLTVEVNTKRGDRSMWMVVKQFGKPVWEGPVSVSNAKAVAATLSSAAVRAQPQTGYRMGHTHWASQASVTADAAVTARTEASLFDEAGI